MPAPEPTEPLDLVPPPPLAPFVLVDDRGLVIVQMRGNGQKLPASYRTLDRARAGAERWGGRVWSRLARRYETGPRPVLSP